MAGYQSTYRVQLSGAFGFAAARQAALDGLTAARNARAALDRR